MKNKISLTAANLKWIAIILMFVNHACYCLNQYIGLNGYFFTDAHWYITRAAFIIFSYQIAEGMYYTKNRKKYITYLFVFAFASEIIYDLCFFQVLFDFSDQNVFFNLALGALAIYFIDKFDRKPMLALLITILSMAIALLINSNYGCMAEALIVCFYYFRDNKKKQLLISAILFILFDFIDYAYIYVSNYSMTLVDVINNNSYWMNCVMELHGLLAWPLLNLYKGEKGRNINKWFFYLFYPGHLLLLYLFCVVFR